MIIKALNTFVGVLDLSAMERLQEANPYEKCSFRISLRPGQSVEVDDGYYGLASIQNAMRMGYVEIGNLRNQNAMLLDHSYSGVTVTQIAGENLPRFSLVYYQDDRKVYRACANTLDTMVCSGLTIALSAAGDNAILLTDGFVRDSSLFSFTTSGTGMVYVSDLVIGGVTQSLPIVSEHIVQSVGYATSTDTMHFRPDLTYIGLA